MIIVVLIVCLVSFLVTFLIIPKIIKMFKAEGLVGVDINKTSKKEVVDTLGPSIVLGMVFGVLTFTALRIFYFNDTSGLMLLFASIVSVFMIMINGFLEDLTALIKKSKVREGFKQFKRMGFSQWFWVLMPLPAAIPLMAVRAGVTTMTLPFFGVIDLGLLYILVLVPLAIVGASNATNLLAGLNGLELGLGAIVCFSLGVYAYLNGSVFASILLLSYAFSLLAGLRFNFYPSRVFPGDSVTFSTGAVIAAAAIIGNIEKAAVIMFVPWIIEFFLKARSRMKAESFGVIQKDGTLKSRYKKVYSLTHIPMKYGKFTEKQIVLMLWGFSAVFCIIPFLNII